MALSGGVDQELFTALNKLAENRPRIERAIVVWVDLIEVLVQQQEKQYGPRAGLGAIKAAELKKVIRYLLRNEKFNLPNVPESLQPLVMDYIIDWTVDAVVMACNRYGLWQEVEPRPSYPFRLFVTRVSLWFSRIFKSVIGVVARIILWVRRSLQDNVVLSPELRTAVEAVEKEGMIAKSGDLIRVVRELISFIGSHRKQLVAAFELVMAAVQEAETFASLTGPEKKEYAINLVFAVLDELGFEQRVGLLAAVVQSIISGSIETAVHLFNKRGVFAK